jgi:murein DD-endopeptidase MepM/ murein hydrolase activator NlpD
LKLLSDLRLSNARVTEQFTALILTGVTAVVIGGVVHLGAHRQPVALNQSGMIIGENAPTFATTEAASPIFAAMDAAPVAEDTAVADTPAPEKSKTAVALQPLAMAPLAASALQDATSALKQAALAPPARSEDLVRTAEIGRNRSLASLLASEAELDSADTQAILRALATVHKEKLPRGLEISMRFALANDDEILQKITFQPTVTTEVRVSRQADGSFKAEKVDTPLERHRSAVAGTIRTNLIEAGLANGVPRNVMSSMIRAFSHEIDFQRDIHPGDKFRVLYDQPKAKNGQAVGDATIIYAAIETKASKRAVYRVIYKDGSAEYFNDRAESVKRGLMRTPIDGARMSSGFGMRRHPIMGYSKFHQGVDFAAATGTPIFAAGDGVVTAAEFQGGYGRIVIIRHRNGLETAYAHMSRFGRGLQVGDRLNQGDVIGYVGSSGRSTGPHLHFEVRVNGQAINPMNVNMASGSRLTGKTLAQFNAGKAVIESEFRRRTLALTDLDAAPKTKLASARPSARDAKN